MSDKSRPQYVSSHFIDGQKLKALVEKLNHGESKKPVVLPRLDKYVIYAEKRLDKYHIMMLRVG